MAAMPGDSYRIQKTEAAMNCGTVVKKAGAFLIVIGLSLSGCVADPVGYYDGYAYGPLYGSFDHGPWRDGWDHSHGEHGGWGHGFAHGGAGEHGGFGGHGRVGGHGGGGHR